MAIYTPRPAFIQKNSNPNASNAKRIPKSVVVTFIRKYHMKLRRVQQKKNVNKSALAPELMQWHCTLREGLVKTRSNKDSYNVKWGRFQPEQRLNVDQVPLPFAIDRKTIPKERRGSHKVWVSNPASGLEKRQCTLQLSISPKVPTYVQALFSVVL